MIRSTVTLFVLALASCGGGGGGSGDSSGGGGSGPPRRGIWPPEGRYVSETAVIPLEVFEPGVAAARVRVAAGSSNYTQTAITGRGWCYFPMLRLGTGENRLTVELFGTDSLVVRIQRTIVHGGQETAGSRGLLGLALDTRRPSAGGSVRYDVSGHDQGELSLLIGDLSRGELREREIDAKGELTLAKDGRYFLQARATNAGQVRVSAPVWIDATPAALSVMAGPEMPTPGRVPVPCEGAALLTGASGQHLIVADTGRGLQLSGGLPEPATAAAYAAGDDVLYVYSAASGRLRRFRPDESGEHPRLTLDTTFGSGGSVALTRAPNALLGVHVPVLRVGPASHHVVFVDRSRGRLTLVASTGARREVAAPPDLTSVEYLPASGLYLLSATTRRYYLVQEIHPSGFFPIELGHLASHVVDVHLVGGTRYHGGAFDHRLLVRHASGWLLASYAENTTALRKTPVVGDPGIVLAAYPGQGEDIGLVCAGTNALCAKLVSAGDSGPSPVRALEGAVAAARAGVGPFLRVCSSSLLDMLETDPAAFAAFRTRLSGATPLPASLPSTTTRCSVYASSPEGPFVVAMQLVQAAWKIDG